MKFVSVPHLRQRLQSACRIVLLGAAAAACVGQAAAQNALADAPLFTASGTAIKPNIMFILDDSGSMQWDFMPDAADVLHRRHYGRNSPQCNGLAYDPLVTYEAPVEMDNSTPSKLVSKGNAVIADYISAKPTLQTWDQKNVTNQSATPTVGSTVDVTYSGDGLYYSEPMDVVTVFKNDSNYYVGRVTRTLSSGVRIEVITMVGSIGRYDSGLKLGKSDPVTGEYYVYTGSKTKLAWYKADGTVDSTFQDECTKAVTDTKAPFTKVLVTSLDTAGQQNYANWSKYYRTRMTTMQSAASIAFRELGDRYRIGYSTIGQPSAKSGISDFVHIDDFLPAQKKSFYTQLHAAKPGTTGTPLRGALAKAGQYYANKAINQDKDPIQYSCQRNYAILSTDGYWNEGAGRAAEGSDVAKNFGPYGLDYKNVGSPDSKLPRPMADGNTQKVTTTETWTVVREGRWDKTTGTQLVVTKKNVATSAVGDVEVLTREKRWSSNERCNSNNPKKYYMTAQPQQRVYRGTQTRTTTEITTTPTTNTETFSRKMATDYKRIFVVDNGSTISDDTTFTDGTPTETKETETGNVTGAPVKTTTTDIDTNITNYNDWKDVGSSYRTTICETSVSSTSPQYGPTTSTPKTLAFPAGTNSTTSKTEALPVQQGWVGKTTDAPTAKVSTATYESKGGVSNSLADVAAYYYETDLRNANDWSNCKNGAGKDVCEDNVPGSSNKDPYKSFGDSQRQQHMTTFTLGMGVSGSLKFDPRYQLKRDGDFHDIVTMAKNWPNSTSGQNTTVDDLWHAAVNGRGQYFSAGNPGALTAGLNAALAAIDTVIGSAAAASTSSLQPVEGDNDIFVAQFTTKEWTGDVLAYKIDPNNGDISKTPTWSAKEKLEGKGPADRKIYYRSPGQKKLVDFTFTNLGTDSFGALFTNFCGLAKASAANTGAPQQCATMTADDKTLANSGTNLVNYLRGDQTMPYYRERKARLADVINASPLFVGKPGFKYSDEGYDAFKTAQKDRAAVVLAAANDGMLHAFSRDTGVELWAYVPTFVMENMPKLADEAFQNFHHYFVDGAPQMGDVYDSKDKAWKTIVVGGLGKGGRGYYALDLTDPAKPVALWEFTHQNLGYTYGNPIITKRKDGKWVVVFASGYENGGTGDGNGHLFVLDAISGEEVPVHGRVSVDPAGGVPTKDSFGNPVGTAGAPSGLARINAWVDSEFNNTALRFYGGDELGNLWRFDIDGNYEPEGKALLLAQLQLPAGTPQPITTKPVLAEIEYNGTPYPVIYVGTGSYMRDNDPKSKGVQTMYAIKDPLTDVGYGDVRNGTFKDKFVVQTVTAGVDDKKNPTRSGTSESVDWNSKAGWRADFPVGGERVTVNPVLALDTLFVPSNLPKDEDCSVGGDSFLYKFNILTGATTATYVGNVLLQGLTVVQLTTGAGAGHFITIGTKSDGTLATGEDDPGSIKGVLRRTSWREIVE